ncbi:type 1 glutamine amidotransferase [Yoonia sp.]|uniref:type 1 glutamine amidotransferase n=1 Tax=Yoonia sp. TaxID=2212373 RepID=UPI0023B50313
MKIGILQTGHVHPDQRPITGDIGPHFSRMLDGFGFAFETYMVVDMVFPTAITECDGWIITGSKHGAYDDLPFIAPLEKMIREVYATDIPLVGVCFGHQIIAQALGGKVEKFSKGWAIGNTEYDWNGEVFSLNAWHQDQVVERPAGATVFATNDFCKNAALVYGRKAFTVQPHPEYGRAYINGLIEHSGKGKIPDVQLDRARAGLDIPDDNGKVAAQIARFFKDRIVA